MDFFVFFRYCLRLLLLIEKNKTSYTLSLFLSGQKKLYLSLRMYTKSLFAMCYCEIKLRKVTRNEKCMACFLTLFERMYLNQVANKVDINQITLQENPLMKKSTKWNFSLKKKHEIFLMFQSLNKFKKRDKFKTEKRRSPLLREEIMSARFVVPRSTEQNKHAHWLTCDEIKRYNPQVKTTHWPHSYVSNHSYVTKYANALCVNDRQVSCHMNR